MIRTETTQIKFPQSGWLGSVIVERIRRIRLKPNPQASVKEKLSVLGRVTERKKKP